MLKEGYVQQKAEFSGTIRAVWERARDKRHIMCRNQSKYKEYNAFNTLTYTHNYFIYQQR